MNQTLRYLILSILACALLLSCEQSGQSDKTLKVRPDPRHNGRYVSQFPVMSTDATIIVAASDQDTAQEMIEKAAERIKRVDRLMSSYRDGSEVSRINEAGANEDVEVSDITLRVLHTAKDITQMTKGAFDITY
ncbi:MAG: FAD:protein FMN transferase, partial [Longimicrobiales bacterium]